MITALTFLLILIEVIPAAAAFYLLTLVIASLRPRRAPRPATRERRFAVLVPAHNEEALISRTLTSLNSLDYPRPLFDVHVVADNCDDKTAELARRFTPHVHKRRDDAARGKGQALRWLLDRLDGSGYDAYAFIDADSVVAPDFLRLTNAYLETSPVVQGHYAVLNENESWVAALRGLAYRLIQYTRRLGLTGLGASAGLGGNGMVFAAGLRQAHSWEAFGITEDLELHAGLVADGVVVTFAPEAVVRSEMPNTLHAARSQNARWERGRLALARQYAPRLLRAGLRERSWPGLIAAVDLLVPPLSVVFLLAIATLGGALALGAGPAVYPALATLAALTGYVLGGLLRAQTPLRLWAALLFAPVYVLWKGWLYLQALSARRPAAWVRTSRQAEPEETGPQQT